ncbi:MAG TPA: hypothetical protein VFV87_17020 [Pirellulaceae bacterium]|nr:hypothetical protein [Pirellulaceae bacterium]
MAKPIARRQLFVNGPIQGALVTRVAVYWLLCMFVQVLLLMFVSVGSLGSDGLFQPTPQIGWQLKLMAFSTLLTLPLLTYDIIKLSHRWVGPIYRLQAAMHALAMGEAVEPVVFRAGDYWKDLGDDFNAVLTRVEHLQRNYEPAECEEAGPVAG